MKKKLRILFLEDVPSDATLVQQELRKAGFACVFKRVDTKKAFVAELGKHPDVILSDHGLPGFDGLTALMVAQKKSPNTPFIFVTDWLGEKMKLETFEEGAAGYVSKRELSKLPATVRTAMRRRARSRLKKPLKPKFDVDVRFLIESVKDYAILELDVLGNILFWNAGATELYKYEREEMISRNISALYPENALAEQRAQRGLQTAIEKGISCEEDWLLTGKGRGINVQITLRPLIEPAGKVAGFVHVSHRVGEPAPVMRLLPSTEERYRELVEFCPCPVMVIGTTGQILYCNSAAAKLLGAATIEELLALTFKDIVSPDNGRKILDKIRKAHEARLSLVEHELVRLDQSRVMVEISANPVIYLGAPQLEIVVHDITERQKVEQAHQEGERRIRAILETALDAIVCIDNKGQVQEWNPAAERIFGYQRSDVLGRRVDELVVPEHMRKKFGKGLTEYLMTDACTMVGRPMELILCRDNGEDFCAELSITFNAGGDLPYCTALVRDISERKHTQAALHQSEERFRLMVEAVTDYAIYMLDAEGRVTTWNPGAERLEGYKAGEIIGKPLATFFLPEDVANGLPDSYLKRAETEGRYLNEGWRVRKDGSRFWSRGVLTALRDETGKLQGFAKVAHDRTRQKLDEEEIHRLNATLEERVAERTAQLEAANAELEAFSYSVSHDLRSPLRHISGYIEILRLEAAASLDESTRRHLATITESAHKMGQLVDALLAFSRIGRTELRRETVHLGTIVDQARRELTQETMGRKIQWNIKGLASVRGDAFLLRQVIVNLLSNALKYTRKRNPAIIEIGSESKENEVIVYVRDNGVGFDMKYADKLFGVFQRLHRANEFEGTGIGLANVRRVIHRHGGRTWAEGKVNVGATFCFSLPKGTKGSP